MRPTVIGFGAVLLATGAMRLVELAVSRNRMAARPKQVVAEPWLFPAMAALHALVVFAPLVEVTLLHRPFIPMVGAISLAVLVLATGLRAWTLYSIGPSWNVRVVVPGRIATSGPYRYIRHPNYLVVVLELAALPMLHTAWLSALVLSVLNAVVLRYRIRTEESALAKVPEWVSKMQPKKRFIPGIY